MSNPSKINQKKLIFRHIRVELKSKKDTKQVERKEIPITLIGDFLATLEVRRQGRGDYLQSAERKQP